MISVVSAKICGLSDEASLAAALAGGARRVGFIFFPRSPRYLEVERAAALAARVPEGVDRVGVMVDPGDDQLARLLAKVPLEILAPRRFFEQEGRLADYEAWVQRMKTERQEFLQGYAVDEDIVQAVVH